MNLTQLERIKSELKRRFYGLKKTSGKTVNRLKRILNLLERNYGFRIGKHNLEVCHGLWVRLFQSQGSL